MILDAGSKLIYHYNKVKELLETGKTYPVHITVGLTNYCNHRCVWCYIDFAKDMKNRINANIDKMLDALKEAKEYGAKAITIVGDGESTLHPEFEVFLERVHGLGYDIGLFTNGSWKRSSITDAISKYCRFVRFSVDSCSKTTHTKTHLSNDFDLVIENIKSVVNKRAKYLTVGVQFAFNQYNIDEIEKAAEFYKALNVDYISYKPVYKNELNTNHEENRLRSEIVNRKLQIAKKQENEKFKVYWKKWQIEALIEKKTDRGYKKCRAIWLSPYIDEDGNVEFCGNLKGRGFTIGNIYENKFSEIWGSKEHLNKVKQIDLSKCPIGCKLHALNLKLESIVNPNPNDHVNFI
ncbi:radical SAM protein [Hippea jasoniae]|uniref:radical SAM protein n=1 Tax=Hippea jasoniae TaxID=944479 RepID=UPI00055814FD|nr:radical SAM protein [Hippea jasoniae]